MIQRFQLKEGESQHKTHPPFRRYFNILSRTGIITNADDPSEPIQAISDGNVQRFSKDAITLPGVCNDLGVSTRDIQDDGISGTGDLSTHLDVCVSVVVRMYFVGDI